MISITIAIILDFKRSLSISMCLYCLESMLTMTILLTGLMSIMKNTASLKSSYSISTSLLLSGLPFFFHLGIKSGSSSFSMSSVPQGSLTSFLFAKITAPVPAAPMRRLFPVPFFQRAAPSLSLSFTCVVIESKYSFESYSDTNSYCHVHHLKDT